MTLIGLVTFLLFLLGIKEEMKLCLYKRCNANMQSMTFHNIYPWPLAKMK